MEIPSVKLLKSQLRLVQSSRQAEDALRRKDMHEYITGLERNSKLTAKQLVNTHFKGDNQWYTKGPMSLLVSSLNHTVHVTIKVGRQKVSKVTGKLALFDRHFNLLIQDVTLNRQYHSSMFIRGCLVVFITR